jgi:hypothetical protein
MAAYTLEQMLLGAFSKHVDTPEPVLRRVENACGVKATQVNAANADRFLECVSAELLPLVGAWKAKFVTGVVKALVDKNRPK